MSQYPNEDGSRKQDTGRTQPALYPVFGGIPLQLRNS